MACVHQFKHILPELKFSKLLVALYLRSETILELKLDLFVVVMGCNDRICNTWKLRPVIVLGVTCILIRVPDCNITHLHILCCFKDGVVERLDKLVVSLLDPQELVLLADERFLKLFNFWKYHLVTKLSDEIILGKLFELNVMLE